MHARITFSAIFILNYIYSRPNIQTCSSYFMFSLKGSGRKASSLQLLTLRGCCARDYRFNVALSLVSLLVLIDRTLNLYNRNFKNSCLEYHNLQSTM